MILAQITDFHVSLPDSPIDREYNTSDRLSQAVKHIQNFPQKIDAVIATGDLVEKGLPEEYRRLRSVLDGLDVPLYLIPGNHDDRAALRLVFADHHHLATGEFIQYAIDLGPIRLIALDTQIPGKSHGELCLKRLQWLDDQLSSASETPTIIAMHHPPFVTGMGKMDEMGLSNAGAFGDIIGRHTQVERILCGHMHRPITRRFHGTVASVCPSTSHQIELDFSPSNRLAVIKEPPGCQLHIWLPGEGLVTHDTHIGNFGPPHLLFDGQRWLAGT